MIAHIIYHPYGFLFACNRGAKNIAIFDSDTGRFVDYFVENTPFQPVCMALGPDNDLFIGHVDPDGISRYDMDSRERLGDPWKIHSPFDIAFGPGGDLFVSQYYSGEIERLDPRTGENKETFASGIAGAYGIAFKP